MSDWAPDYVDVAERLRIFRATYPDGRLQGEYEVLTVGDATFVVYRDECYRDPLDMRPGVGTAWERVPGKTPYTRDSELQNAETSAWGRAIVAALVADWKRVSSADEIRVRTDPDLDVDRATSADRNAISTALKTVEGTELRASVQRELRDLFGPPSRLLAEDVPAVLEHIESARALAAPFDGGGEAGREETIGSDPVPITLDEVEPDTVVDVSTGGRT